MLRMSATGTDCTALSLGSLTPPSSSNPIIVAATYNTDQEVKLVFDDMSQTLKHERFPLSFQILYTNVCYSDGTPCKLFTYTVREQYMANTTVSDALIDIQVLLQISDQVLGFLLKLCTCLNNRKSVHYNIFVEVKITIN